MEIDFVVTWVDGADEDWLKEKKEFLPDTDTDPRRFRDWDLLKYWFRGVEKYAPWVNKIHFVTWGHIPEFLDINHPKLNIVKHEDYLDKEYRPTFNANTIELNFHKIKGLSECFVYFNDDSYLIKNVEEEDFFEGGLPKDVAILNPIVPKSYDSVSGIMMNDIGIINKHFSFRKSFKENWSKWLNYRYKRLLPLNILFQPWNNVVGLYQQHLPTSLLKTTIEEVWKKEPEILHETSKRKHRDIKSDVNQWLFKEWLIMEGKFEPRNIDFGKYIMIENIHNVNKFRQAKDQAVTKVVCLNDHVEDNLDEIIKEIKAEFDELLGEKSEFEL